MHILIEKWRREAEFLTEENFHTGAAMCHEHADELERAWHDECHQAFHSPRVCAICRKEMEAK